MQFCTSVYGCNKITFINPSAFVDLFNKFYANTEVFEIHTMNM